MLQEGKRVSVFRFRFEQILNVRKLAEERVLQEFSAQVRGLRLRKDRLRSIRGEKEAAAELMPAGRESQRRRDRHRLRVHPACGSGRSPRWS